MGATVGPSPAESHWPGGCPQATLGRENQPVPTGPSPDLTGRIRHLEALLGHPFPPADVSKAGAQGSGIWVSLGSELGSGPAGTLLREAVASTALAQGHGRAFPPSCWDCAWWCGQCRGQSPVLARQGKGHLSPHQA